MLEFNQFTLMRQSNCRHLFRLEKYYEDIKKVEVSLKVVKPEVAENKEAGIKILIPNGEFYASKVCDTFEEAIDLDVEALVKQLVKYKEKQRSK